jgi:hypothetical protein
MKAKPMGMLLMMLGGWINRHQQDGIAYLKEENKILREKLGTGILRVRGILGTEYEGHCTVGSTASARPRTKTTRLLFGMKA